MKRRHLYFLSLIAVSLIASCTKDDDGTTNQSTIIPPVDNSDKITGTFLSQYVIYDVTDPDNPGLTSEDATVTFMRSIQENILVLADTVYVNRSGLIDQPDNSHYLSIADDGELNMRDSCVWEVVDTTHDEIPSFIYNFRAPYPSILGKLPDTVAKATGFNMNIKIAEADSVVIGIEGDTLNNDDFITKTVSPTLGNYGFTFDEIKSIRPSAVLGNRQRLVIQAYKTTIQKIEGRYFRFTKLFIFNASVWVERE